MLGALTYLCLPASLMYRCLSLCDMQFGLVPNTTGQPCVVYGQHIGAPCYWQAPYWCRAAKPTAKHS